MSSNLKSSNRYLLQEGSPKHLPPRLAILEKINSYSISNKQVLTNIQTKVNELENSLLSFRPEIQEQLRKKSLKKISFDKSTDFRIKPFKKSEQGHEEFKDVFILPSQNILKELTIQKAKKKQQQSMSFEQKPKRIDASINFSSLLSQNFDDIITSEDKLTTIKEDSQQKDMLNCGFLNIHMDLKKEIEKASNIEINTSENEDISSFEKQIEVQPPDHQTNEFIGSHQNSNKYAPSIPISHNFKENKSSIKDLLVRAKAGMQAGDIQKEAHLTFYLGQVHESNKNYKESIKFYKRFIKCAKIMKDKIGVAVGSNRIGTNYFYLNRYQRSIDYHQINLSLSNNNDLFAAYYNLGMNLRKLNQHKLALDNFELALEQSKQNEELEHECLTHGQMGLCYSDVGWIDLSVQSLNSCNILARQIKNKKLEMESVLVIVGLKHEPKTVKCALECALKLGDKKVIGECCWNMGVIIGSLNYNRKVKNTNYDDLDYEIIKENQ